MRVFPSRFDWNALKSPKPRPIDSGFSLFLIPKVLQIELFAASPGSSILKVFGIQRDLSELFSSTSLSSELVEVSILPSRECFPKGEVGAELGFELLGGDGWAIQGIFHAPGTAQPQ